MATYNGEQFIKSQIDSILSQLKSYDELIISDDGSQDSTISIIESYNDERIKLYHNEDNSGRPTENFQNALYRAKGNIIFLADQDDIWLEKKYLRMLQLLSNYDLVISDSILVDENLNELQNSFFRFHGSKKGVIKNALNNSYFGSCMAFRNTVLNYALPFPKTREIGHDIWIGLVAEMVGKVHFLPEPLILYRRHAQAVTAHGIGKSRRGLLTKIWSRFIVLKYVSLFYIKHLLNDTRTSFHNNTNV